MRNFHTILDDVGEFFTDNHLIISAIIGIVSLILLMIFKPSLWIAWIITFPILGYMGLVFLSFAFQGIGYALIYLFFPFALLYSLLFPSKKSIMDLFIDTGIGFIFILFLLSVSFPIIYWVCSYCDNISRPEWGNNSHLYSGEHVYICTGGSSKKYHSKPTCKGLRSCSKDIEYVYQSYAEERGRTPCKWCY